MVEDGKSKEEALAICEEICKYSRHICALGKAFFYTQIEQNINTANRFSFFNLFRILGVFFVILSFHLIF